MALVEMAGHGEDCGCDDCRQNEHDALLVTSTELMISEYLEWRAGTYAADSVEARTVRADAAAVRRGAWRRR